MTDKELLEQFQLLAKAIGDVESRMATKDDIAKIEIKIENEVTHKIEALFDGYKLTHEKQWELERRMEKLERLIAELQSRIA